MAYLGPTVCAHVRCMGSVTWCVGSGCVSDTYGVCTLIVLSVYVVHICATCVIIVLCVYVVHMWVACIVYE